ncbi:MAG: Hsp20/alpha crystallin family protein [Candidatus Schekmanbacteria bacterium]|nr:Hsp20/alpha crystallin family protein [Candidatus Schekmanbacteria bacterium]
MPKKKKQQNPAGGILKGLTDLVEALGDLAEKGEAFSRVSEINLEDKKCNPIKGVFGFSIKTGLQGNGIKVEPFGNIRKDKTSGESIVREVREPIVDVFEEEDHVLVVAEMPGIQTKNIRLSVKDDILTIYAENSEVKYRKEILLPGNFTEDKISVSCKNGIAKIKCNK